MEETVKREGSGFIAITRNVDTSKKTKKYAKPVNKAYLKELEEQKEKEEKQTVDVVICNTLEMDEMWSYYHDKSRQVWLW